MAIGGYLKLFRKIINWEWYDDVYIKHVFIDLLIKANYKDKEWHGILIKRGQFLTSRRQYANELHISEQKLRGILKKLETTNEIKITTTQQYTLITIVNYEMYQSDIEKATQEQPTNNPQNNPPEDYEITHTTTHSKTIEFVENSSFQELEKEKVTHTTTHQQRENQPTKIQKNNPNIINNNNINNIKLNKTKLNLLFNYLINKEKNFENLTETDKTAIVAILKRLDMYITNIECLPENRLFQLKLEYWTITEIYTSPYKIYLNELTRNTFMLKYLQTEKYIGLENEDKIGEFISYFITCLRKEFEKM